MKTTIIRGFAVVAMACMPVRAQQSEIAQTLVSSGRVLEVSKETGNLTLRSQQAVKTLVFRGLRSTPVYFATGRRATFGDIEPGQSATIYYAPTGGRTHISRIVIPDPEQSLRATQALTSTASSVPQTRSRRMHSPRVPITVR